VAPVPDSDLVAVRDSKDPEGPALVFDRPEVRALVEGCKEGRFDHLMSTPSNG
jgi:hypothetical protein